MQILAEVYRADAGHIYFDGRENIDLPDERAAQDVGIALVYQERSLFGPLSVAENIFAARQPINRSENHYTQQRVICMARDLRQPTGLNAAVFAFLRGRGEALSGAGPW